MKAFEFSDYRAFIRHRVESLPKRGHGQYRKMAEFLGIQTSMLSQIMAGQRDMNAETASKLCDFFALNDLESDYFLCLVQLARAGNMRLKSQLRRQLDTLHRQAMEIDKRIPTERKLDETAKATFYSQWYYSGIRLLTAIEGFGSSEMIAERLDLPLSQVARVLEFLVEHGLCIYKNGKLSYGAHSTHVSADSPLVTRHHLNWRLKAMENFEGLETHELLFTSPTVVTKKAAEAIKRKILDMIDEWAKIADASESENLMCLNVDWVEIK